MTGIGAIVRKELKRVFQDKKLVFSLFILPVFLMVGIYSLIGKMQTNMHDKIEQHEPIIYIKDAPVPFKEFLEGKDQYNKVVGYIEGEEAAEEIKQEIYDGKADLLVIFEENFLSKVEGYQEGSVIPEVKTYYNPSEDYSAEARENFTETILQEYQQKLLKERIGDLESITVFYIDKEKESSIIMDNEKAVGKALGMMLPYFITMMLFAGAMGLGVDAVTGEKERGTLASMLVTPLKRINIVMGKILSLIILSCLSAFVYAISLIISMPKLLKEMGANQGGALISFSPLQIFQLLSIMLSLVIFYVAVVVLVAVLARTAKEANTYVTPIYIIVIISGLITMFQGNTDPKDIIFLVPLYGSSIAIQNILMGDLSVLQWVFSLGSTLGIAAILILFITKAFNSERVMFQA